MILTFLVGLILLIIVGYLISIIQDIVGLGFTVLDMISLFSFLVLIVASCFAVGMVARKVFGF